jgi:hypothetical protein
VALFVNIDLGRVLEVDEWMVDHNQGHIVSVPGIDMVLRFSPEEYSSLREVARDLSDRVRNARPEQQQAMRAATRCTLNCDRVGAELAMPVGVCGGAATRSPPHTFPPLEPTRVM